MDGWVGGWMDGCMHACMDGCMHACMHVAMYVCMYARMHVCMYIKYQVFDTSLCIDLCSIHPCFEPCTAVYSNPRCLSTLRLKRPSTDRLHRWRSRHKTVRAPKASSAERADCVDSSLVDTRRPKQTRIMTGRYSTW